MPGCKFQSSLTSLWEETARLKIHIQALLLFWSMNCNSSFGKWFQRVSAAVLSLTFLCGSVVDFPAGESVVCSANKLTDRCLQLKSDLPSFRLQGGPMTSSTEVQTFSQLNMTSMEPMLRVTIFGRRQGHVNRKWCPRLVSELSSDFSSGIRLLPP